MAIFLPLLSEISAVPASGDSPAQLTYRTIGGILDFYVFTGPSPADVVKQYLGVVGLPYLPPYWGLGYHLCRWGYMSSDHMKKVIKRMRDGGFPFVSRQEIKCLRVVSSLFFLVKNYYYPEM